MCHHSCRNLEHILLAAQQQQLRQLRRLQQVRQSGWCQCTAPSALRNRCTAATAYLMLEPSWVMSPCSFSAAQEAGGDNSRPAGSHRSKGAG